MDTRAAEQPKGADPEPTESEPLDGLATPQPSRPKAGIKPGLSTA